MEDISNFSGGHQYNLIEGQTYQQSNLPSQVAIEMNTVHMTTNRRVSGEMDALGDERGVKRLPRIICPSNNST